MPRFQCRSCTLVLDHILTDHNPEHNSTLFVIQMYSISFYVANNKLRNKCFGSLTTHEAKLLDSLSRVSCLL